MRIHERIRAAREAAGRTIADVARATKLDYGHLHRFEEGKRRMSSDKVDLLLEELGLTVQDEHGDPQAPDGYGQCLEDISPDQDDVPTLIEDTPCAAP